MEAIHKYIQERRKQHDPLISDVLKTLDQNYHIYVLCKKPWYDYRDEEGNLYTLYPVYNDNKLVPGLFDIFHEEMITGDMIKINNLINHTYAEKYSFTFLLSIE